MRIRKIYIINVCYTVSQMFHLKIEKASKIHQEKANSMSGGSVHKHLKSTYVTDIRKKNKSNMLVLHRTAGLATLKSYRCSRAELVMYVWKDKTKWLPPSYIIDKSTLEFI